MLGLLWLLGLLVCMHACLCVCVCVFVSVVFVACWFCFLCECCFCFFLVGFLGCCCFFGEGLGSWVLGFGFWVSGFWFLVFVVFGLCVCLCLCLCHQGQWSCPWSILGNPSPMDLAPLPQLTATSCTINSDFPSFSGIQARRAEILPTSSLPPVVGFMQLSFRKPATMSRTSLIASEHTPTTWTLLSCSTRTPLSQTPQPSRSRPTPRAKIRGAWYYSSFVPCCDARLFPAHLQSHFARYISTMWWPRNVMHPLSFSSSFMPKCWSTMSTS